MLKRQKTTTPEFPVDYPAGTFVETEKGYFYIVTPSKRYRLLSKRVLDSWRPHRVVKTSEAAVAKYRVAAKMKFRNGSLLHSLSDGKIYLVVETKRRPVVSPDALTRIGARYKDAVTVSNDELNLHDLGDELN